MADNEKLEATCLVELLPPEYTRPVVLIAFQAAMVPKALGSAILKLLQAKMPISAEYVHLKRVRSPASSSGKQAGHLEVLLCPASSEPLAEVMEFLASAGCAACHSVQVPRFGAFTREQLVDYSQHWPLTYRKPSFVPLEITSAMEQNYASHLSLAAKIGGGRCGCVIVDAKGRVLAEAVDESSDRKPLAHAVMVAIEKVAEQRVQARDGATAKLPAKPAVGSAAVDEEMPPAASRKRPIEELAHEEEEEDYLCHDCEVITTHEPCIMCAMALIHSRVRLVAYRTSDPEFGGLGGRISLHTCHSLNHQFRVLQWTSPPSSANTAQDKGCANL